MADKILATLTSKGQITLPAQHRKAWGLKPGDQIAFDPPGGNRSVSSRDESEAFSSGSMN
jgi:AbrB family looped-hinge helix DNA binding protein